VVTDAIGTTSKTVLYMNETSPTKERLRCVMTSHSEILLLQDNFHSSTIEEYGTIAIFFGLPAIF